MHNEQANGRTAPPIPYQSRARNKHDDLAMQGDEERMENGENSGDGEMDMVMEEHRGALVMYSTFVSCRLPFPTAKLQRWTTLPMAL